MKVLKLKPVFLSLLAFALIFFFQNVFAQDIIEIMELDSQLDETSKLELANEEILEHLASKDEIMETLTTGENITEQDLKKILSEDENMNRSQRKNGPNSSGAVTIYFTGCYRLMKFCKPPFGDCDYYWEDFCKR